MISNINKLSMKEIIKRIGFPLSIDEFGFTYKLTENSVEDEVEFENGLTTRRMISDIQDWICNHERLFDKEVYVLHIARLLEKDIEEAKRQDILGPQKKTKQNVYVDPKTNNKRRAFITARDLLKDIDTIDIEVGSTPEDIRLVFSQDYIGNTTHREKKEEKVQEKLDRVEETIGLDEVLKHLNPDDLIDICKYPNLASVLRTELYKRIANDDDIIDNDKLSQEYDFSREEFEKIMKKFIYCMDIDKILVLSANNYLSRFSSDFSTFLTEDLDKVKTFVEKADSLLERKKSSFISKRGNGKKISIKQTLSALEEYSDGFINGVYYDYKAKNDLIEDIIFGNVPLNTLSKEDFTKKLNLTIEEKAILVRNNPDALSYFIQNEILSESEFQELLTFKNDFSDEQFVLLMQNGIIKKENILELYLSGKITLENINAAKLGLEDDLSTIVSNEKLVELYLDEAKKDEFEKYRKIYKLLVVDETKEEQEERKAAVGDAKKIATLDAKVENRRKENGYAILEQSYELLDTNRLFELYHWGIINVDVIVECSGMEGVSQLYASKELKPIDARRLYDNGALTAEMLEDVFKSGKLTETEKLVLIYSTFSRDDETDSELRAKFIKMLREPVESEKTQGTGETKAKPTEEKDKITSIVDKRQITDPFTRWHLISKLDKEYSQEYLRDGTIIFYLPNEGVYITEKLYAKGNVPAYGYATYIIDKDVFETERENIVKEDTLNQTHLVNMKKNKAPGVTKLVHTGWANSLIRFFEIEESEKYTKEEKDNIKKIAEKVEESKKPLNRDDVINL